MKNNELLKKYAGSTRRIFAYQIQREVQTEISTLLEQLKNN